MRGRLVYRLAASLLTVRRGMLLLALITLLIIWLTGNLPTAQQIQGWRQDVVTGITGWINRQAVQAGFVIRTVSVSPLKHLSQNTIVKQLALDPAQSSLFLDVVQIQKKLEKLGWVRKARVRLFYPRTLHIHITEAVPLGVWKTQGQFWLIGQAGQRIVPVDMATVKTRLPVLVGTGADREAASFLTLLQTFPKVMQNSISAVRIEERRWDLSLRSGLVLSLPETGIRQALRVYQSLAKQYDLTRSGVHGKKTKRIDLRLKDRVIFR